MAARPRLRDGGDGDTGLHEANVRAMAWYLGMNLVLDEPFMHLAEEALDVSLPEGWVEGSDEDGRAFFWQNGDGRGESNPQWEHPADAEIRRRLLSARTQARQDGAGGEAAGPLFTEHAVPAVFRPRLAAAGGTVEEFASYLGMDLIQDRAFLWVAEAALTAPLPDGWSVHSTKSCETFFHNSLLGITQWQHPMDAFFRSILVAEKAKLDGSRAPLYPRPMPRTPAMEPAPEVPAAARPVQGRKDMAFGGGDAIAAENFIRLSKVCPLGIYGPRRRPSRRQRRLPASAAVAAEAQKGAAKAPATTKLHVHVVEARNLRSMDTFGLSDPMAIVRHQARVYASPVVRRTVNPNFVGANFEFPIEGDKAGWGTLIVEVKDVPPAAKGSETSLGCAKIALTDWLQSSTAGSHCSKKDWVKLQDAESGEVLVWVEMMPTDVVALAPTRFLDESEAATQPDESLGGTDSSEAAQYTEEDVRDMAVYLGMNPLTDEHMFWLAEEALIAPVPLNWSVVQTDENTPCFVEARSGMRSNEHPMDPCFRSIFLREKEAERVFEEREWSAVQLEAEALRKAMESDVGGETMGAAEDEESLLPTTQIGDAERPERDGRWKQFALVPTQQLTDLMFDTIDCGAKDGWISRRELRSSKFGDALVQHWRALDDDKDHQISKTEWNTFFSTLNGDLGNDEFHIFVTDLVWEAELDATGLVPPPPKTLQPQPVVWEQSAITEKSAQEWASTFIDGPAEDDQAPSPINAKAVEYMAKYFGVDLAQEVHMLDLIRQAVCAAMPDTVIEVHDPNSGVTSYFDSVTRVEAAAHPFEDATRSRIAELRRQVARSDAEKERRLATLVNLDHSAIGLSTDDRTNFEQTVGVADLLCPPSSSDSEPWASWAVRVAGTPCKPWVALGKPNGAVYYALLDQPGDEDTTTSSAPFDFPSLEEVSMQLHWHYRIHGFSEDTNNGVDGARGRVIRPRRAANPRRQKRALDVSRVLASNRTVELAQPLSRGGDDQLEPPPRGRLRPGARALSKLSSKAERRAARAAGRPARCVWYSQLHTADLQHWFEQSTRQGLFHDDTPLIDAEQYASFVGRLKARLMTDEMQYGSANLRVQHGAQLLVMMCNICALRELAANRHVPALQLLKQAQQISDGVAGYTFPARRRCHAWTLDSLAYYYVRRGKFSGALSYLRKAYAITNPSEVHDVNLGTTSPRRSQRDVNLGASFRSAATLAEKGLTPSPMRGVDVLLHTRCSVVRWCLVCLCTLFLHAAY